MMTPEEFVEALHIRGLAQQDRAAAALGLNQATISRYRAGTRRIPRPVEIAVLALPFAAPRESGTFESQRPRRKSSKPSNGGA